MLYLSNMELYCDKGNDKLVNDKGTLSRCGLRNRCKTNTLDKKGL